MSRPMARRYILTGTLEAQSAVHVGGLGAGLPELVQARDGRGRPVLPGTSLAGVIRAALDGDGDSPLWGLSSPTGTDDGTGRASWIRVDDAYAPADAMSQAREHVGIDRIHGTAATGHLYTREVLPAGTGFAFRLIVDEPGAGALPEEPSPNGLAESLVRRIADVLAGSGIRAGAGTTRGLGHLRLRDPQLRRADLTTKTGMVTALLHGGTSVGLDPADPGGVPTATLLVEIPWRPRGPVMVQVSCDGDVVKAIPLTAETADGTRLVIPGSTVKGVLRSHAERIVRTALEVDAPGDFLDQLRADGLEPVPTLFGTAGDRGRADASDAAGRRGALTAHDCLGASLPVEVWAAVRRLESRGDGEKAELTRLQQKLDELNRAVTGVRFVVTPHVAIDRWTGGAADSRLFAVLEPHAAGDSWQPIVLDIDTSRLGGHEDAVAALLLLVLRDLCDGWLGFGHGTTRGMGAVRVDPIDIRFHHGDGAASAGALAALAGRTLADVLADTALAERLAGAWPPSLPPSGNGRNR